MSNANIENVVEEQKIVEDEIVEDEEMMKEERKFWEEKKIKEELNPELKKQYTKLYSMNKRKREGDEDVGNFKVYKR
jgi:hypothetical protein